MKKLFSLVLILATILIVFSGCGGKDPKETGTKEKSETNDDLVNAIDVQNFSTTEFKILDANDYPDMHYNISTEYGKSTIENAIYNRDQFLSERYNIDIEYDQKSKANVGMDAYKMSNQSGDMLWDMIISTCRGGRLESLASEGLLCDLSLLPTLTLQSNWWSPLIYRQLNIGGSMFFTTGDIAASVYDAPMVTFANVKLLNDYQMSETDLYDLVRDGGWTAEYMTSVTKDLSTDLNEDGVMHANNDFFSVICQSNVMTSNGFLTGLGYSMGYVYDDTTIVVDNANDELLNRIETIKQLVTPSKYDTPNDVIDKAFKSNRAIFLIHLVESAKSRLNDMDDDFSILPMPKYSESQRTYNSSINGWVDCFVGVPAWVLSDTEYTARVGYMMEATARAAYELVRPQVYDILYLHRVARDPGSSEMLEIVYNTLYTDFNCIYDFGTSGTTIGNHIFKGDELTSTLAGLQGTIETEAGKVASSWIKASQAQRDILNN